jgi:hypothetical protein
VKQCCVLNDATACCLPSRYACTSSYAYGCTVSLIAVAACALCFVDILYPSQSASVEMLQECPAVGTPPSRLQSQTLSVTLRTATDTETAPITLYYIVELALPNDPSFATRASLQKAPGTLQNCAGGARAACSPIASACSSSGSCCTGVCIAGLCTVAEGSGGTVVGGEQPIGPTDLADAVLEGVLTVPLRTTTGE